MKIVMDHKDPILNCLDDILRAIKEEIPRHPNLKHRRELVRKLLEASVEIETVFKELSGYDFVPSKLVN